MVNIKDAASTATLAMADTAPFIVSSPLSRLAFAAFVPDPRSAKGRFGFALAKL
jgi:hypothetical protein